MSVFKSLDYKYCLRSLFEARKRIQPGLTYAKVAETMNIQKAYLSKVLNQDAHLNQDQLYLFCDALQVKSEERQFLSLLLERQRSGVESRRIELDARIAEIQKIHNVTEKHIESQTLQASPEKTRDYYLDAFNQLVHVCLSKEDFCKRPLEFASKLGLSEVRLQKILTELERLNIIENQKSGIKVLQKGLHLPKGEKVFQSWRIQTREMASQRVQQRASDEDYTFTVFFSSDSNRRREIQAEFFKFIEKAQKLSRGKTVEGVYQMNFDLIEWL